MGVLGPVLVVFGAMLGAAAQISTQAEMSLRVPSLFAAFVMVAQGLLELQRQRRQQQQERTAATEELAVTGHGEPVRVVHAPPAPLPHPEGLHRGVPAGLMLLAGWLGVAVLTSGTSALMLSVLATIAGFLLFALGWLVLFAPR